MPLSVWSLSGFRPDFSVVRAGPVGQRAGENGFSQGKNRANSRPFCAATVARRPQKGGLIPSLGTDEGLAAAGKDYAIRVIRSPTKFDQLLRNAELRDELERYFDESISRVNVAAIIAGRRERVPGGDAGLGTGAGAADLPLVRARAAAAAARIARATRTCTGSSGT